MRNIQKETTEIISVGADRRDVKVFLNVISQFETVVRVLIAVRSQNNNKAKDKAEEVRNHEILCLHKLGYGQVGKPEQKRRKIGKRFFIETKYVFQWTKWKHTVMHTKKPK